MSTPNSIAAVDSAHAVNTDRTAGTVELLKPPREAVEWMESPDRPTDLWCTTKVRGEVDPYWHELKSAAQIADLVHALTDPQDLVQPLQELTAAETIDVLVSWAQGHGLPLPYGAALRTYGNPPDPGLVA